MSPSRKETVAVVGSGNWGSAIGRIAARNAAAHHDIFEMEVRMWIYEEEVDGKPLSHIINTTHINSKYLPDVNLGENLIAEPDIKKAVKDATLIIIVVPHQFLDGTLNDLQGSIRSDARVVSLVKGISAAGSEISAFPTVISKRLGIPCSALSGANIATGVAHDVFSESTLGVPDDCSDEEASLWKMLFDTPTFRIHVVKDVEGVSLCGGLKNIIALAAGFVDGLGWDANSKAAIIRIGLVELHDFCREFFPSTKSETFLMESCGIADIITSCLEGRNRKIGESMVKTGKSAHELEETELKGQKLEGAQTALDVHNFLDSHKARIKREGGYPLFETVWKICYDGLDPKKLVYNL